MKKSRVAILTFMFMLGVVLITSGATLAFFQYKQNGTSFSTITSGSITFHYQELDGKGHGIGITDAMPVSSNTNAMSAGNGFNFKITSKTNEKAEIPYTVTAKINQGSDEIMGDIVYLYLTEVNGNSESPTTIFEDDPMYYNDLNYYRVNNVTHYDEKVILTSKVPAETDNYNKNYRLRMWIDQYADFSTQGCSVDPYDIYTPEACTLANGTWGYLYNNKEFSITLNVYSTGSEPAPEPNENKILIMRIDGRPLFDADYSDIFFDYDFRHDGYCDNPDNDSFTSLCASLHVPKYDDNGDNFFANDMAPFTVETEYRNANVVITKTEEDYQTPLAYSGDANSSVTRISYIKQSTLPLTDGYNRFKIELVSKADPSVIYDTRYILVYYDYANMCNWTNYNEPECSDLEEYSKYDENGHVWASWFQIENMSIEDAESYEHYFGPSVWD